MKSRSIADLVLAVLILVASAVPASAGDVARVPLWDGETFDPTEPLLNRFGGGPVFGISTTVELTTDGPRSGQAAYRIDTQGPIAAGGFDFVGTALTSFFCPTATSPCPVDYVDVRDLTPFTAVEFWVRNQTGASFSLVFEIKDYRDADAHRARRSYPVAESVSWQKIHAPLDLGAAGWTVFGEPDLEQAKLFALVLEANLGESVDGTVDVDDMVLVEPDGPLDSDTAPIEALLERLARRQFDGLWGSRDRTTGLMPSISSFADVCATNVLAAMIKLLPGAVARSWLTRTEADAYVATVVSTLDQVMDDALYLPPRYLDRVTLEANFVREESSVDAAFLFLALYQYKGQPGIDPALATSIGNLLDRFDFASFATAGGWDLAYLYDAGSFTGFAYDGYSGEPWLISLAAHLAATNHVPITANYHSAVFRTRDYLADPAKAHLVHSDARFRAPFLQWLLPLFVDVRERGIDSFPDISLATNPFDNAVLYQQEVHAKQAALGRAMLLQPDAGDDGTGSTYEQFSCYEDHGQPDLFMPWSSSFSFLADPAAAEAALRALLSHGLHGPLGLTDSALWQTGAAEPYRMTARHDFWNVALSTMALHQVLFDDNQFLTQLAEVQAALDLVFPLFRDGFESGDVTAWSSSLGG